LIGDDRLRGIDYKGDKYVLGDGGCTNMCSVYRDVGGHELKNLWSESVV
jgi:hypothetical protein